MKKLFLFSCILMSSLLNAQWQTGSYVDEFGDKTGDTFQYIFSDQGVFSNSATQNSKLSCNLSKDNKDNSLLIYVYEYGRNLATDTETTFTTLKIKTPSEEVKEIKKVMFSKTGMLYLSGKRFEEFNAIFQSKGTYTFVFDRVTGYSMSTYRIKVEL